MAPVGGAGLAAVEVTIDQSVPGVSNAVAIDQTTPGVSNGVVVNDQPGEYATPTHSELSVTVASQVALAANVNRLYALFINDSDSAVYLKLGAAAVAHEGVVLNPNGGNYPMSKQIGNLYTGAVYAIHGAVGNKVLTVLEGV